MKAKQQFGLDNLTIHESEIPMDAAILCFAIERERRERGISRAGLSRMSGVDVGIIERMEDYCEIEYFEHLASMTRALDLVNRDLGTLESMSH